MFPPTGRDVDKENNMTDCRGRILLMLLILTGCVTSVPSVEHIKITEYQSGQENIANSVYIFSADWCEPCKIAKPIVEKEATVRGDRVVVVEVNDLRVFDKLGYKSLPLFRITKLNPPKDEIFQGWDEQKFLGKYRAF